MTYRSECILNALTVAASPSGWSLGGHLYKNDCFLVVFAEQQRTQDLSNCWPPVVWKRKVLKAEPAAPSNEAT